MSSNVKIYNIAVIGAGASGMMAAITAARNGKKVLLIDKNPKAGIKLALSGNGRGNITNTDLDPSNYHGGSVIKSFCDRVFTAFGTKETIDFMESIGISTISNDGWIYPRSGQASSVVSAMEEELSRLHVTCKYNLPVSSVEKTDDIFSIHTDGWTYFSEKIILSCGSKAHSCAKDGPYGYDIAASLGHTIKPVLPALTGLRCKDNTYTQLAGVRVHGKISVEDSVSETGELQFTNYGISGIPTFCLSHEVQQGLKNKEVQLSVNFLPDEDTITLIRHLTKKAPGISVLRMLNGLLPLKVCEAVLKKCRIKPSTICDNITLDDINILCKHLTDFQSVCFGTLDFEHAQVCMGGINLTEVDPRTMESMLIPGLFITGEMLDMDGKCGGYNLQWAFSTGYLAGSNA